jgi:hypothetical protein
MKIIYTESALKELANFEDKNKKLLEATIAERKYVFGDETLEITAADVRVVADKVKIFHPRRSRLRILRFTAQTYIFLGLITMVGSFFYRYIVAFFSENPKQAAVFMGGVVICILGFISSFYYRYRSTLYDEQFIEERNILEESARRSEDIFRQLEKEGANEEKRP